MLLTSIGFFANPSRKCGWSANGAVDFSRVRLKRGWNYFGRFSTASTYIKRARKFLTQYTCMAWRLEVCKKGVVAVFQCDTASLQQGGTHLLWPKKHHWVQVALHWHVLAQRLPCYLDISCPVQSDDICWGATHSFEFSGSWTSVWLVVTEVCYGIL